VIVTPPAAAVAGIEMEVEAEELAEAEAEREAEAEADDEDDMMGCDAESVERGDGRRDRRSDVSIRPVR